MLEGVLAEQHLWFPLFKAVCHEDSTNTITYFVLKPFFGQIQISVYKDVKLLLLNFDVSGGMLLFFFKFKLVQI